jgi:hypothetical protein
MKRLRLLSALLGCLAVLSAGLSPVALAWAPSSQAPAADGAVIGALCSQECSPCESAPCPPSAAGCIVACVGVTPSLGVASFTLSGSFAASVFWPVRLATLHGLAPPPDPLPPRA